MCPVGTQWPPQADHEQDLQLKVINSGNKKEFKVYTLRRVKFDGSVDNLKEVIRSQCGSDVVPPIEKMEIGYYYQCKKMWINNRLDLNDAWTLISKGEKITLWCVGICAQSRKRETTDTSDEEHETQRKKSKVSKAEEKRAIIEDYERQLKEKHEGNYTRFQLKLWAEMLAAETHNDLNEPPTASMFSRSKPKVTKSETSASGDSVVSGMMTVVNTLCQSVLSNQKKPVLSPVKKAELRSTYMQQLTGLHKLQETGIITDEEYEEQRHDIVQGMRHLSS